MCNPDPVYAVHKDSSPAWHELGRQFGVSTLATCSAPNTITAIKGQDMTSPAQQSLESPRLAALHRAVKAGNDTALAAFWHDVARLGTPLVEPTKGDDRQVLVTFLWRAQGETRNVIVEGGLDGWGQDLTVSQMAHLPHTDLWYQTRRARTDVRTTYLLAPNDPLTPLTEETDWKARTATWQPDPLNPHTYFYPKDDEDPDDEDRTWSVLTLPAAAPQPWITPHPGVPTGSVACHRLQSRILDNERRVWVYLPPVYEPGGEQYGLLLLFDGCTYIDHIPTPTILDNLYAAKRLPPLVAVMLTNPNGKTRGRELPCYPPFADFLSQELLPWIRHRYHVTTDPARTVVAGASYGGLAAAFAGLRRPDLFGNVLSQSGAFWWKPEGDPEDEWLVRQFAVGPTLPLRFYLDVGLLENKTDTCLSQLAVNRHLRNVLHAKGYSVSYAEFSGGHDVLCWRGTFSDGLMALIDNHNVGGKG